MCHPPPTHTHRFSFSVALWIREVIGFFFFPLNRFIRPIWIFLKWKQRINDNYIFLIGYKTLFKVQEKRWIFHVFCTHLSNLTVQYNQEKKVEHYSEMSLIRKFHEIRKFKFYFRKYVNMLFVESRPNTVHDFRFQEIFTGPCGFSDCKSIPVSCETSDTYIYMKILNIMG